LIIRNLQQVKKVINFFRVVFEILYPFRGYSVFKRAVPVKTILYYISMKTTQYNPSPLELNLAAAFQKLKEQLQAHLPDNKILDIVALPESDNPVLLYTLEDQQGDKHELVVQFIQRPDGLLSEKDT
jgi:hypothetical protein